MREGGGRVNLHHLMIPLLQPTDENVSFTQERPTIVCPFIEYEAEDDDARGLETTGDYSVVNGYVKDSFINDDTVWDEDVDTTACSGS